MPGVINIDMEVVARALVDNFPQITHLHLFGSRRHRTRSLRSDIDLLVEVQGYLKPSELRAFITDHFPAVDPFILESGGRAVSCINDSYVEGNNRDEVIRRLQALSFWNRSEGRVDVDIDWQQPVAEGLLFRPTVLPNLHVAEEAEGVLFGLAEQEEMPTQPYLGSNAVEVARSIVSIARRMVMKPSDLGPRGAARTGWTVQLASEYDLQNLFWTVFKPWLPKMAREEITIKYDGQLKIADFNYAGNRILFEMKHVKDSGTKAAVVKTLSGLRNFYASHANIRVIVFMVLVDNGIDVDEARWEADYSYVSSDPKVITAILRNP